MRSRERDVLSERFVRELLENTRYFMVIPAALITRAHFAISSCV